ncbi:hypothetical protein DFS33DRAFT_639857 [Desarmillaria ectypa]|nr:hypothetical protein DFS33DRAFT_639857 [Desarmillaria ectypa]
MRWKHHSAVLSLLAVPLIERCRPESYPRREFTYARDLVLAAWSSHEWSCLYHSESRSRAMRHILLMCLMRMAKRPVDAMHDYLILGRYRYEPDECDGDDNRGNDVQDI